MPTLLTYFVHGTTTDNEADLATGILPGALSRLGRQQAAELGSQVADRQFDVVFCSDLKRAVDSAQLGFGDKYTIVQDERLRECDYGDMNGAPNSFKDTMNDFVHTPFPNGESYKDVEKRIAEFLTQVKESYDGKHVAVVAHQAPQLAIDVIVKGETWAQAIANDWRPRKEWQPGWDYEL